MRSELVFHRWLVIWLVLGVMSCGFKKAKEDAELAVARHFEAVGSHSEAVLLAGYDPRFYSAVPREEWAKRLALVETKLGQYKSFTVASWNVQNKIGTDGGTYVSLTCKVTYSKHPADEAMVFFRASDDDEFKIIKHGIVSEGLL
jgi:hypothetical protein